MPLVGGMQLPDTSPEEKRAHDISNENRGTIWNAVGMAMNAKTAIAASRELVKSARELIRRVKEHRHGHGRI